MHFLSRFFEKSRKCDAELFAKSKKSEKREKNSEIIHAQNQLSADGSGGGHWCYFSWFSWFFYQKHYWIIFLWFFCFISHKSINKGPFFAIFSQKHIACIFFLQKHYWFYDVPPPSNFPSNLNSLHGMTKLNKKSLKLSVTFNFTFLIFLKFRIVSAKT